VTGVQLDLAVADASKAPRLLGRSVRKARRRKSLPRMQDSDGRDRPRGTAYQGGRGL